MFKYIFFLLLLPVAILFPQQSGESDFKLGLDYLNSYQYESALNEFSLIADDQNNPNYTAAIFFKGKIEFMLSRYDDAVKTYSILFNEFPNSKYIDEARIVSAKYSLSAGKYLSAIDQLCMIIKNTSSQEYLNAAKITGKKISAVYLNEKDLDSLFTSYKKSKVEPFLFMCRAVYDMKKGNVKEADSLYQFIIKNFPDSDESKEALINRKGGTSQENIIGVLLPLTVGGNEDGSAEEILEGIKFAVDEFNETAIYKTGLIIKDTERDSSKIKSFRDLFVNQRNIKAVLGPVYSDEVRYTLETLKDLNLTVMSPTATENDLTKTYPDFIQANSSFSYRGRIIAQYIYYVENKRRMSVLTPTTGYASQLSESFKSEFKKLGGRILSDQVYKSGSYEISKQVANIAAKKKDLEGIYLPLTDKSDAAVILSQLENSGIDVNLYGNQDWFNAKGFQSSSNLSNKLIFSSDYFIDYADPVYTDFNRKFREKTGTDAGRNELYGYDAAKCLLTAMDGTSTRETIMAKLCSGTVFQGYHNNLDFDSNRMNKVLNIIRYKDGVFELIDRFKAGK